MEPSPPPTSLAAQLASRLRGGDWRIAAGIAVLLALAPLGTIAAATLMAIGAEDRTAARARAEAVALARVEMGERRRAVLGAPTLGATLEGLARTLPEDASVLRAERGASGKLTVQVATADPDRLRAALRREPATAGLRDVGQQGGPAGLIVTLEDRS